MDIEKVKKRMAEQMPKILKEIDIYQQKLKDNTLNIDPQVAPQFNE